jgi:hypothetical protein
VRRRPVRPAAQEFLMRDERPLSHVSAPVLGLLAAGLVSSPGMSCCNFSRSCSRSSSPSIRCEMPMCRSCGRYTSSRPAMLICVDSRAPIRQAALCDGGRERQAGFSPGLHSVADQAQRARVLARSGRSRPVRVPAPLRPSWTAGVPRLSPPPVPSRQPVAAHSALHVLPVYESYPL